MSTSTQSRMELGQGAGVALATWASVAEAVGADLFAPELDTRGVYPEALAGLMASGGWSMTDRRPEAQWFERPVRPYPGLPRVQMPAERAVVRLIQTVTGAEAEFRAVQDAVEVADANRPAGMEVAGTLVVIRSTASVRRSAPAGYRLSSGRWLSALRSPGARMPRLPGWVWLAPSGTHLLPWGA